MTSNLSSEYKVVADKLVSPDEDIIVQVRGALYKDSVQEPNRYATMSDIGEGGGGAGPTGPTGPAGPTGPTGPAGAGAGTQTWVAPNDATYEIHQAHGGVEVILEDPAYHYYDQAYVTQTYAQQTYVELNVDTNTEAQLIPLFNGSQYLRVMRIIIDGNPYRVTSFSPVSEQLWGFSLEAPANLYPETSYAIEFYYGGPPVLWWDADDLEGITNFRGAKIEYHCYSQDAGNMIGTIYIANDSGDFNTTHIEVSSGANDLGNVVLWKRDTSTSNNERRLHAYRTDNESDTLRIQWTAQIYCGPELYD